MTHLMSGPALAGIESDGVFTVRGRFDDPLYVLEFSGELDLAGRAAAFDACTTSPEHLDVQVDLSGLMFMDCAGYGALVEAGSNLRGRGGSMALINGVGEPQRLLTLISELEPRLCSPP